MASKFRAMDPWIARARSAKVGPMALIYAVVFVAYFVGMAVLVRKAPAL